MQKRSLFEQGFCGLLEKDPVLQKNVSGHEHIAFQLGMRYRFVAGVEIFRVIQIPGSHTDGTESEQSLL